MRACVSPVGEGVGTTVFGLRWGQDDRIRFFDNKRRLERYRYVIFAGKVNLIVLTPFAFRARATERWPHELPHPQRLARKLPGRETIAGFFFFRRLTVGATRRFWPVTIDDRGPTFGKFGVIMPCSPPVRTVPCPTLTVFSKGGNAPAVSDIFVCTPQSIQEIAPLLAGLRATVGVTNATGDFMSQAVFQTTSDGITWDAAVPLETAASDNRQVTTAWFTDLTAFKRGIRVGVLASQETGVSTVQMARVALTLDFLLRA